MSRYAEQVGDADPLDLTGSMGSVRQLTHSHRHSSGVGLAFGWLRGDLARDVSRQVQTEAHIPFREKTEVLSNAFARIDSHGLQPTIVFDDTDRWILDDNAAMVTGFFRDIVRWLTEFPVSVVVAAHARYLDNGAVGKDDLLEFLDTQVTLPRLPDEGALATILERRISLNVVDVAEHQSAHLDDAITTGGVHVLHEAYAEGLSLRRVIQLAHVALAEAISAGADLITADHVAGAYRVE